MHIEENTATVARSIEEEVKMFIRRRSQLVCWLPFLSLTIGKVLFKDFTCLEIQLVQELK